MKKFGLIGKSLQHSFSKNFFTRYFDVHQIDAEYFNVELDSIDQFLEVKNNFDGCNVTIPYKEVIIPFLDDLDDTAKEIGAVNTVKNRAGKLIGYNTDAYGFAQSIKPFLTNRHERAMIIGTGGASKAVAYSLEKLGIDVIYISRNPVGDFQFGYEEVNDQMIAVCKLIVNCTPLGTFPNVDESPEIDLSNVNDEHLVVDLIYNPEKTKFLKSAESHGATIMNGLSMLELQALKSYDIWSND
jgi:shikimate dehydrogenase